MNEVSVGDAVKWERNSSMLPSGGGVVTFITRSKGMAEVSAYGGKLMWVSVPLLKRGDEKAKQ